MNLISLRGEILTPRIRYLEAAAGASLLSEGEQPGELSVQFQVQRRDCLKQFNLAVGHAIPRTRAKTPEEEQNEQLINALYAAITIENTDVLKSLLAPEIEWWYHGPPSHQHMKALLTGETTCGAFTFGVTKLGLLINKVFVEGCGQTDWNAWVHVWTTSGGKITELREYYNTSIMVVNGGILLSSSGSSTSSVPPRAGIPRSSIRSSWSSASSFSTNEHVSHGAASTLWQNSLAALNSMSIPGIVFYIDSLLS